VRRFLPVFTLFECKVGGITFLQQHNQLQKVVIGCSIFLTKKGNLTEVN